MLLHFPPLRPTIPTSPLLPRFCFSIAAADRRVHFLNSTGSSNGGNRWKFADIDTGAVQQRLSSWLFKAQTLLNDVALPLVKPGLKMKLEIDGEPQGMDLEMFLSLEITVDRRTPNGYLSFPAAVSIEQFGRMSGLTGRKMQRIFKALAPQGIQDDARSLIEYCCFRYLSRDSSDFHPNLKDLAFRRLIFITMLAWEQPYSEGDDSRYPLEKSSLQTRVVGESAFVRIAPAVAGVADASTCHYLFRALAGDEHGISLNLWTRYIAELIKVHQGRKSHQTSNYLLPAEQLLCIGYSRQRPVLKWEDNIAWPGNLTLTDSTLYFEGIQLRGYKEPIKLNLSSQGSRVEKTKVGPFGSKLLDSAVSVSSGSKQETWILEFVDFVGESRRDVWHSCISEIISLYEFIREYGPDDEDATIQHVYGAHRGRRRAISSAANSIARLQSLQYIQRLPEDPNKLVQFSYLKNAPEGDIVLQALAVSFWGGPLVKKFEEAGHGIVHWSRPSEDFSSGGEHVFDLDGSVYLRKWMKSSSWTSSSSVAFWKISSIKQGIILAKNLVVSDLSLIERAALTCKEKSRKVEKTQATLDAAMIKGIPSNIDLFKELVLPCTILAQKLDKLRRWEEPVWTSSFLVVVYVLLFSRNLLPYAFPVMMVISSATMLLLKGLKEQGRLGRSFGKVTIRDQPPSNTIQKIVALKEAISDIENRLQNLNISLLKFRTIILAGQPEVTNEVALLLLGGAIILLFIPFKYIAAFIVLDLFTRELEFRREMTKKFMNFLRERWAAVYASPVVILPYENKEDGSRDNDTKVSDGSNSHGLQTNLNNSKP
ncbi:hypothetical protein IEQ34_002166 [Dendrobium chrysotoxum]|uniref:Uncharacterized protein n=1 Tax=Dendrobium chrysotoxum TaxID=161865 RepID=A0AAV7HMH0_DENCH|nr:hypothetical protein IEQ34_002166 [Dendrobium chrysotoxum]